MASHAAAAGTRYAVRLKPPMQGSVLAVRSPDAKASATSSYEVVRKPQEPFNGMQVGRRYTFDVSKVYVVLVLVWGLGERVTT